MNNRLCWKCHFSHWNSLIAGNNNIPWLGDFRYFGTADEAVAGENSQFPIKPEKRSYSQNCVVWIKQAGLQSDIQKLLRHAKKLPEKTQQFYKVNRNYSILSENEVFIDFVCRNWIEYDELPCRWVSLSYWKHYRRFSNAKFCHYHKTLAPIVAYNWSIPLSNWGKSKIAI